MTDNPKGMLERALEDYPPPRSTAPFGDRRPRSFSFEPEIRKLDEALDRRRAEEAGR